VWEVEPFELLHLARYHCVPDWLDKAFRAVIAVPLRDYTRAQQDTLGHELVIVLAWTREAITERRRDVACTPPNISSTRKTAKTTTGVQRNGMRHGGMGSVGYY